jgi:hypothetical protein
MFKIRFIKKLMMNLRRGESATTWGKESNKSIDIDRIDYENKDTTAYDGISETDIDTIVEIYQIPSYNSPPPFKLIIHGGPGTEKTRFAESIVSRMRQHRGQVACAAPTGVASSLLYIERTLHNLFDLPTKRKQGISSKSQLQSLRADQLTKARYRFDNACLLIDEMSMIDTTTLDHISTILQQITAQNAMTSLKEYLLS